jgi:hypothetical protein
VVTVASVQDRDGARLVLRRLGGVGKKLRTIWVDGAYRGQLLGGCRENLGARDGQNVHKQLYSHV